MIKFIKKRLVFIICLILFFVPFFWFTKGEVDFGGDSTRLYFYDPVSWLKNVALYSNSSFVPLGDEAPSFYLAPLLLCLTLLKGLTMWSYYHLNNIFNGILLAGSFLAVYGVAKEVFYRSEEKPTEIAAIISGLFFSLSPIQIYEWQKALYSFNQILVYPLFFYLFLRFINRKSWLCLIGALLLSFIFAVNFSYNTAPWLFAFAVFAFSFFFFYSAINHRLAFFSKGLLFFALFFLGLHSFHLLPQIYGFLNPNSLTRQAVFANSGVDNQNLAYFLSVQPYVRIIYNLVNQPQYYLSLCFGHPQVKSFFECGVKYLPLYFIFPIVLLLGVYFSRKKPELSKRVLLLLFLFLGILFFMTANILGIGLEFYKKLFLVPGFGMFRSFYTKFAMTYVFFYAILFGCCLSLVGNFLKKTWQRMGLYLATVILIIISGWPLISGKIVNEIIWMSNNVQLPSKIDSDYEIFSEELKSIRHDAKVTSPPWTNEMYQVIQGEYGGAYFGPPLLPFLAGRSDFCGGGSFAEYWPVIQRLVEEERYDDLNRVFNLLNIGYIFHNDDNFIYNNFSGYPYSPWFKDLFVNQLSVDKFIADLNFKEVAKRKYYHLYKKSGELLPHFYAANERIYSNGGLEYLPEILAYCSDDDRLAIYTDGTIGGVDPKTKETLSSGADKAYLTAEPEEKFVIKSFVPDFSVTPKSLSPFRVKMLKAREALAELKVWGRPIAIIEKGLLYSNRRVQEVTLFDYPKDVQNDKRQNYEEKVERALSQLPKINNNEQIELAWKVRGFLEGQAFFLSQVNYSGKKEWFKTIKALIKKTNQYLPLYDLKTRKYSLEVPKEGEYSLSLQNLDKESFGSCEISIDGEPLAKEERAREVEEDESSLAEVVFEETKLENTKEWGKVSLLPGNKKVALTCNSQNLIAQPDWQASNEGAKKTLFGTLPLKPDQWYQVSGTASEDAQVEIRMIENLSGDRQGPIIYANLAIHDRHFYYYFKSTTDTYSINWEISQPKEDQGKINELYVDPIQSPRIILRSDFKLPPRELPKLIFRKINPSRYEVMVSGATKPFTLVFSQRYHSDWKLFLVEDGETPPDPEDVVASHYGGQILELEHQNLFWKSDMLDTFKAKAVADDKHFLVNGYANAWQIDPGDFDNKTNYKLVVEYIPQRMFLYGVLISLTFIIILAVFASILIWKRKARKVK